MKRAISSFFSCFNWFPIVAFLVYSTILGFFLFEVGYTYGERTGKYAKNYTRYCDEYRNSVTIAYAQEIRSLVLSFKEVVEKAESERDHWKLLYEEKKILKEVGK